MAQEPVETVKYAPEITALKKFGDDEVTFHIPVPAEQEWLYAMLDRQEKILADIKTWVTFFGILAILSVVLSVLTALGLL